jgi:Zn finger protein HypA/HybF involved in hydrogenase expression
MIVSKSCPKCQINHIVDSTTYECPICKGPLMRLFKGGNSTPSLGNVEEDRMIQISDIMKGSKFTDSKVVV